MAVERATKRSFPRAALASAALLCLAGCVESDDVTVKADGSGSFQETMAIDVAAMQQLSEMMKSMMPPGFGPPPGAPGASPSDPSKPPEDPLERLKQRWKDIPGLEVTKATSELKDGKSLIKTEATFRTLEAYAQASGLDYGAELTKADDGSYTLKFERRFGPPGGRMGGPRGGPAMGDPAMGDAPPGAPPMGEEPAPPPGGPMAGMLAGMMPMLEKHLAGLELSRTLRLPGEIVSTNGTKSEDGKSVSWKVTFDDIKNQKIEPQTVTFKGDGLDLKPFKVKARRMGGLMGMGGPGGPPPPGAPPTTPTTPSTPPGPGGDGK